MHKLGCTNYGEITLSFYDNNGTLRSLIVNLMNIDCCDTDNCNKNIENNNSAKLKINNLLLFILLLLLFVFAQISYF
jgi:hypothetical protein